MQTIDSLCGETSFFFLKGLKKNLANVGGSKKFRPWVSMVLDPIFRPFSLLVDTSSIIHLLFPLTKESVSTNNRGGGNYSSGDGSIETVNAFE